VIKGPRVLALTGEEDGCTLWRVWLPFAELEHRGYAAWWCSKDDPRLGTSEWTYLAATRLEAVILPRLSWQDQRYARAFIDSLHRTDLAVIYDLDDDLLSPQIEARLHATLQQSKTLERLEQDRRDRIAAVRLCDGVITSSETLAEVVNQYTDVPVEVVPNAIDVAWFRRVLRGSPRAVPPLTIGWAGGTRYAEDLLPVAEAWATIARTRPHVNFVIQGFVTPELAQAVPAERLYVIPWMRAADYPRGLKNVDIACCSVAPSHFNRCKTPIKLWEFTLAGAVSVVSPTLYGPVVAPEQDALVAETAAEWTDALLELVDDCELRRRLWKAQRRRVATEHALSTNVLEWPRAWSRIIQCYRQVAA
jgi:glycosyltransferase involved in cell wall biosynthesis